jgi:hypothetical protein
LDRFPNIAELFDLFPFVMFYNQTIDIEGVPMNEFRFSYPLGNDKEGESGDNNSQFLMFFNAENMELNRITVKANSLNITSPFTLYASQPVTERNFSESDMEFKGVTCTQATHAEQEKLNHYVERLFELVRNTK